MARPKYLLIADDLRGKILAGTYPVDSKLPAVRELAIVHGTAHNTVRSALGLLAREGLVESFQGDGIYVRKLPDTSVAEDPLRTEVRELADRVESLELNLANLYSRQGDDYPSTVVAHGKRA